jgi:hypothetical protein
MGALIDKIAASGNLSSYARPAHCDERTVASRAANALALDLAEDIRDLGLGISVAWKGDWVRLGWPSGSVFSFVATSPDEFKLDRDRDHAINRDELISQIARWVETVQREQT